MSLHKAASRIRLPDGSVTTIGEALDSGALVVREARNFVADCRPGAAGANPTRERVAYFADLAGEPGTGWRITPGLYKSRTGQPIVAPKGES